MIQDYYIEYCEILKQIRLDPSQSRRLVLEAESMIQQMTLEARDSCSCDTNTRDEWLERIQLYKSQLTLLQQEAERTTLLQSASCDSVSNNNSTDAMMVRQSNALEQARRSLAETEEIAGGIAESLQAQRRTMEASQQKMSLLQNLTERAHSISDNLNKPWWKKF